MEYSLVFIVLFVTSCNGLFFGNNPDWDDLKVTWGPNPLNRQYFSSQPRTIQEAKSSGYTPTDGENCKSSGTYRGVRYLKDGDTAVMLLFDKYGFIAGIQTGFPKDPKLNYPTPQLKYKTVLAEEPNMFVQTFYFVEPSTICQTGRSVDQYNREGTGNGQLFLQTGANPEADLMQFPYKQDDMDAQPNWVKTKCFPTMGMHYWYNTTAAMDCNYFLPAFALYNSGRLNGFGFALNTDLSSPRYEHPPTSVFGSFFKPIPECLYERAKNGFSTMHVYLDKYPRLNFC